MFFVAKLLCSNGETTLYGPFADRYQANVCADRLRELDAAQLFAFHVVTPIAFELD